MRVDPVTQSYVHSGEVATREACLPDTNLRTSNTLLSIAKLMSLQVVLEEDLAEDKRERVDSSLEIINARLDLIQLQRTDIHYHSVTNKHEIGSKYRSDLRLVSC